MTRQKVTFTFDDDLLREISSYARKRQTSVRSLIRDKLHDIAAEADDLGHDQPKAVTNSYSDRVL